MNKQPALHAAVNSRDTPGDGEDASRAFRCRTVPSFVVAQTQKPVFAAAAAVAAASMRMRHADKISPREKGLATEDAHERTVSNTTVTGSTSVSVSLAATGSIQDGGGATARIAMPGATTTEVCHASATHPTHTTNASSSSSSSQQAHILGSSDNSDTDSSALFTFEFTGVGEGDGKGVSAAARKQSVLSSLSQAARASGPSDARRSWRFKPFNEKARQSAQRIGLASGQLE